MTQAIVDIYICERAHSQRVTNFQYMVVYYTVFNTLIVLIRYLLKNFEEYKVRNY